MKFRHDVVKFEGILLFCPSCPGTVHQNTFHFVVLSLKFPHFCKCKWGSYISNFAVGWNLLEFRNLWSPAGAGPALSKCLARLEPLLRGPIFEEDHQRRNGRNHEWCERARSERVMPIYSKGVWTHATQFHLSSRDFRCPFCGHLRNAQ